MRGIFAHARHSFQSKPHYYNGGHSSGDLSEFVHEILRPSVINLDTRMFKELVENKPEVISLFNHIIIYECYFSFY